jgi:valyl-tRNA synthetase
MIMAGYEYRGTYPFKNVYFTGIVRDSQRRKMSKSLGNSPEPLELIKKYGADGVRTGMLLCSPAGNDLLFDESLTEQGRNFANKIWNAFRLVKSQEVAAGIEQPESSAIAVEWFGNKLNQSIKTIDSYFQNYRISDALMEIYHLFRDEFSSWYLEIIKPAYQQPVDEKTHQATLKIFDDLMRLLHPFMPFITEEIWQQLEPRKEGESIMVSLQPQAKPYDAELLQQFEHVKEAIAGIRNLRQEKNLSPRDALKVMVMKGQDGYFGGFDPVLKKMANLESVVTVDEKVKGAVSFLVKSSEYFIPLDGFINVDEEITKLEGELKRMKGFLNGVMKKLGNEKFVSNAPEKVVELEKKKKADAEAKIQVLTESIENLKK